MYTQRAGESDEETLQRAMRDPEIAVSRKNCIPPVKKNRDTVNRGL